MSAGTMTISFLDGTRVVFTIQLDGNGAAGATDGNRRMSGLDIPFEDGLTIRRSAVATNVSGGELIIFYD